MESDTQTRLDIYPPEGEICDRPIVIWIHGGGWSSGDKQQKIESKIDLINEVGGIFVSVNYRLTSVHSAERCSSALMTFVGTRLVETACNSSAS